MFIVIYKGEIVASCETKEQAEIVVNDYDDFAMIYEK